MKKTIRFISALLCALMLAASAAGCVKEQEPAATGAVSAADAQDTVSAADAFDVAVPDQLQLISESFADWCPIDDGCEYSFAVTDLNQNGRVELIVATNQGTGLYTYADIREVNESGDGLDLLPSPLGEGDAYPDFILDTMPVYYNEASDEYLYVCDDVVRFSAFSSCVAREVMSFDPTGGVGLATYAIQLTEADENGDPVVSYTASDGETAITEEEYNTCVENDLSAHRSGTATFKWSNYTAEQVSSLSNGEMLDMLALSYDGFSVKF